MSQSKVVSFGRLVGYLISYFNGNLPLSQIKPTNPMQWRRRDDGGGQKLVTDRPNKFTEYQKNGLLIEIKKLIEW